MFIQGSQLKKLAHDWAWFLPVFLAMAIIVLLIGRYIGGWWATGYVLLLTVLLLFNAGAHQKGNGESVHLDQD